MLLDNYKKESPIIGIAGLGGGINSYIFLSGGADPYVISKSLRFNSADTPKLTRTPSSASNRKTWTLAFWIKRTTTGSREQIISAAGSKNTYVEFQSDKLMIEDYEPGVNLRLWTTRVFRDPSAWYHIVVAMDTTQGTSSNRLKLYVNGVQETVFDTATYPSQNYDTSFNNTGEHKIGQFPGNTNEPLNAYLADFHLVDGQALAATDFGETDTSGVWQPKKYTGSYGTNGFHLDFKDTAAIGNDAAGSNNWTATNITTAVYGLSTASQGMDVVTYDGNGSSRNISGLAFAPDLVIIKSTTNSGYNHYWVDRVRGTNQNLYSNSTEATHTADRLSSFNSDGFGLTNHDGVNSSSKSYVAWAWKAGGAASSNTSGTITSSVSASTTYGFSIVSVPSVDSTNALRVAGTGLNTAPDFIISKNRDFADAWFCYHKDIQTDNKQYLRLNTTSATSSSSSTVWGHTSTTIGFNGALWVPGGSTHNLIFYCWHEVAGYSKISSYTGSGSAGNKITTGFKPRFLLIKGTDTTYEWQIFDSARNTSNPRNLKLEPNTADAQASTSNSVNFYDDGFDFNSNSDKLNGSSKNYIYAAFASDADQSALDVLLDSPSQSVADETDTGLGGQITGNYATLNPLSKSSQTNIVLANGNLDASNSSSSGQGRVHGTIAMSSGKWYFEAKVTGSSSTHEIGIIKTDEALTYGIGFFAGGYSYIQPGTKFNNNSTPSYGASYTTGDVIGVAFDADNGTLIFYKNGVSQGTAFTGLSGTFYPAVSTYSSAANFGWKANFGQRAFVYAAPSGYKSVTVENLTATIADGRKYFDTKLWTGDGNDNRDITGYGFSPDWVWIKERGSTGDHHLFDIVRGTGKALRSNETDAEVTTTDELKAFNSDGFRLGTGGDVNASGTTTVGWAWEAGSSTVANTSGSINSQVRASATGGFSIVSYTGTASNATIGHGLSSAPDAVITKCLTGTNSWAVYHRYSGNGGALLLNVSDAEDASIAYWNYAHPTSTVFSVGTSAQTNGSGQPFIAYCFSPVESYSSFGSWTGTGDVNGPFLHTGFRPAWIMYKKKNGTGNWAIRDTKRSPHNVSNTTLVAETSEVESTHSVWNVDILSNGFKIRTTSSGTNNSGDTYVYFAFAENPFKNSRAR